jgi:hypothetical protein
VIKAHAETVVDGLAHPVNVFGSFQFENGQPAVPRDSEQIDDSAVAGRKRRNLRMDMPRIGSRRVGGNHGFQPPFRLTPVEPVLGIQNQQMAERFELPDQRFEGGPFFRASNHHGDLQVQTAKAQGHFLGYGSNDHPDGLGRKALDTLRHRHRGSDGLLDFAARHNPGSQITCARSGNSANAPVQRFLFV